MRPPVFTTVRMPASVKLIDEPLCSMRRGYARMLRPKPIAVTDTGLLMVVLFVIFLVSRRVVFVIKKLTARSGVSVAEFGGVVTRK